MRRSLLPLLGFLVVLPAALYVLSWAGWFHSSNGWDRHWANSQNATYGFLPDVLRSWWHYHSEMYGFHSHLVSKHPYQSHPFGWLLLARPVSYYYPGGVGTRATTAARCRRARARCWRSVRRRSGGPRSRCWSAACGCGSHDATGGRLAIVLLIAASIVPWIPSDLHRRTMFLFYALPAVPFMCLGLALMAGWALGPATASARRRAPRRRRSASTCPS